MLIQLPSECSQQLVLYDVAAMSDSSYRFPLPKLVGGRGCIPFETQICTEAHYPVRCLRLAIHALSEYASQTWVARTRDVPYH